MQCVINTLHTPKEDKRMKKAFIIIILCMILQIFTVTVYANDSNVNIVSADNYESREFNQWKRAKYNFSFNVSTEKKTIKALCSAVLTATGTAIGSCGGEGAAIAGSTIGAGISSYASDCIEEHYSKFKKKGYGTSITAMYGSKLRVIISIYSDSARTKLVSEYKMSTDSYPV